MGSAVDFGVASGSAVLCSAVQEECSARFNLLGVVLHAAAAIGSACWNRRV